MDKKDLSFTAKRAEVAGDSYNKVLVEIGDADAVAVLDHFTPTEIVEHVGLEKILEDVTAADIVKAFSDEAALVEALDDIKLCEALGAEFCAGSFEVHVLAKHMNADELLEFIGIEKVKAYFELTEKGYNTDDNV